MIFFTKEEKCSGSKRVFDVFQPNDFTPIRIAYRWGKSNCRFEQCSVLVVDTVEKRIASQFCEYGMLARWILFSLTINREHYAQRTDKIFSHIQMYEKNQGQEFSMMHFTITSQPKNKHT